MTTKHTVIDGHPVNMVTDMLHKLTMYLCIFDSQFTSVTMATSIPLYSSNQQQPEENIHL